MIGFKTKNSNYYIDPHDKTISGGAFSDGIYPYDKVEYVLGSPAKIRLINGAEYKTSTVIGYLETELIVTPTPPAEKKHTIKIFSFTRNKSLCK